VLARFSRADIAAHIAEILPGSTRQKSVCGAPAWRFNECTCELYGQFKLNFSFHNLRSNAMGIGGISIWQLLILLAIVVLVFGTKRLRNMGGDLGAAIKGFRKGMEDEKSNESEQLEADQGTSASSTASSRQKEGEPANKA